MWKTPLGPMRLTLQKVFGSPIIFFKPVTFSQKTCAERKEVLRLPASWTESVPMLERLEYDWAPVPRIALAAWLIFFSLFLYQLGRGTGIFFLMDNVFVCYDCRACSPTRSCHHEARFLGRGICF